MCNKPEDNPTPAEEVAGDYHGKFLCTTYNGQSWEQQEMDGVLTMQSANDTLIVLNSNGCVLNQATRFVFDSVISDGEPFLHFQGVNTQYSTIRFFQQNDSIAISDPWHSSYGWLGREFQGVR